MLSEDGREEMPSGGNFETRKAYSLGEHDFVTIRTIKSLLAGNSYKDLFTLDNHLLILESIRRRLSLISAGETSMGIANWNARQHISELKELISKLGEFRRKLFLSYT